MLDLWVAAWQATMPEIDFAARRDWFAARLEDFSRVGTAILCAVDAATVLGFITIDSQTQYLDQLAVTPTAFGQGVAGELLQAAKQVSPRAIELLVNQDNLRAIRFYEREGFTRGEPASGTTTGRPVWRMRWTSA